MDSLLSQVATPFSRSAGPHTQTDLYNQVMSRKNAFVRPFLNERLAIAVGSFAFLGIGFLLDVATTQELVVAILYNVPIALSGLSSSRRLFYGVVVAALLLNLASGGLNALALGGVDLVAVLNRTLAGLSFFARRLYDARPAADQRASGRP